MRRTDRIWRRAVNASLADYQARLGAALDLRWYLAVPGWQCIIDWRWRQEQDLEPGARYLLTRDDVEAFLAGYQRIFSHMQATSAQWADTVIELNEKHVPLIRRPA